MPKTAQLKKAERSAAKELIIDLDTANSTDRPDYKSSLWAEQIEDVQFVRDVYGGTKVVRDEGEKYLPRHDAEDNDPYDRRKKASVLFNATKETVEGMVGMVLRKDPVFGEETPDEIVDDAENIDLRGRSLPVFAQELTRNAILDGHTFILVEHPEVRSGEFASRADERSAGVRPYWLNLKKSDVINLRWEIRSGRPVLTLVVYQEAVTEPAGQFGEEQKIRYRVLRPGEWQVWERRKNAKGEADRFVLVDEGPVSVPEIPLYAVYSGRTGLYRSEPPLLDLAYENVGHYQVRSDHRYALSFASVPVPFLSGIDPDAVEWGPDRIIGTENPDANAVILEASGSALQQSREELRDIEARMAFLGLQMLAERSNPQPTTATARLLDKAESDSALATTARSVQDGINEALKAHAEFRSIDAPGSVTVNRDFHTMMLSPQMIAALSKAVQNGHLSLETMWGVLIEGEVLPEDFDMDLERERIEVTGPMDDLLSLTELGRRSREEEPPLPDEEAA